jgi:chitinase
MLQDLKPLLLLAILLFAKGVTGQNKAQKHSSSFKIVGYYFLNAATKDTSYADADYVFLNKITHLNIAFLNPDSTGNFKQDLAIDTLVKKAHRANVKVLGSIAGGGPHPFYASLLREDNRKMFIAHLVSLVQRYDLDGIDVDIEGSDIDSNYEDFVRELAAALRPHHKLLTAAIATAYKDQLPDNALKEFDFLNIMSYDRRGPWRPYEPGHHAPYSMAVEDLDYWHRVRSMPKKKLVLGLPFYGYAFRIADSTAFSMTFKEVVASGQMNQSDTLRLPNDVILYYNNTSTIREKTKLALRKAGGVMIWQLLGDAAGEKSLLTNINQLMPK